MTAPVVYSDLEVYCALDGTYHIRTGNATCVPSDEAFCETGTYLNGAGELGKVESSGRADAVREWTRY